MLRTLPHLALLACLLLACAPANDSPTGVTSQLMTAPACSKTALWISPSTSVGCPAVPPLATGSWTPRHLYGASAPDTLARVCAYDWSASSPNAQPDVEHLDSTVGNLSGNKVQLDCPVVSTLGGDPERDRALWKAMRKTFHFQAGRSTTLPGLTPQVRVAILDSAAHKFEDTTQNDHAGHGRLVGRIVEDLACPGPEACAAEIVNELALPYQKLDVYDAREGGVMGQRADLGLAIHRALLRFGRDVLDQNTSAQRLVLNLSVGWQPDSEAGDLGLDPEHFGAATFAVHAVLARAACLGVLTVAAAGNAHAATDTSAVLPGRWESLATPKKAECKNLVGFPEDEGFKYAGEKSFLSGKQRLVNAVAAVDERDVPLATTPLLGQPRLLAYGMSLVTDDRDERGEHTAILTGSSFAAAIASAAVAISWSRAPAIAPHLAVKRVYEAGVSVGHLSSLGARASLCLQRTCEPVRRVSVCELLRADCAEVGCGTEPDCTSVAAGEGRASWNRELFERADDLVLTAVPAPPAGEHEESALAEPWCHGQPPGRDGCVRCSALAASGEVSVELGAASHAETAAVYLETAEGRFAVDTAGEPVPRAFTVSLPGSVASRSAREMPWNRVLLVRELKDGRVLSEDIPVLTDH